MPGAPGTLSVESPASAWTSTTLSGPTPKYSTTSAGAEAPLLARAGDPGLARSRIVHRDARLDELHEVLVGRDDEDVGAGLARLAGVGGDDVVGLVAALLDRDHAEGRDGRAHQRELRHELVGRILPVRLVLRIDVAPERVLRLVEDHREMGGLVAGRAVADELQHFGGEQPNRAGRQAVHPIIVLLILADRLIIGAEDKRRAVDEKNMVAGADRTMGLGHGPSHKRCGFEAPSRVEELRLQIESRFSNFGKIPLNLGGFTSSARRGTLIAHAALRRSSRAATARRFRPLERQPRSPAVYEDLCRRRNRALGRRNGRRGAARRFPRPRRRSPTTARSWTGSGFFTARPGPRTRRLSCCCTASRRRRACSRA